MSDQSMQAKSPGTVGGVLAETSRSLGRRSESALLAEIQRLLREGEIYDARLLAAEATRTHPDHPELRRTHEVLNVGRSRRRPASGSSTREELEQLRDPPDELRGKWVAVVGREIVGVADSLKGLVARLPPDLEQVPLAVQIGS